VTTPTTTDADALREEIRELNARFARGDLPRRTFERRHGDSSLALCRTVVATRLDRDERVELEHHAVLGHLSLTGSVLREPEQDAVSLLLTDRRLVRVRSRLAPGRPFTCDDRDRTVVDELRRAEITGLEVERRFRVGEVAAGAVIVVGALLLWRFLSVTGPFLVLTGGLGILHGLLAPTRTVRLETDALAAPDPLRVHAPRARSARRLLRALRRELEDRVARP
jgi:hypothetical protein